MVGTIQNAPMNSSLTQRNRSRRFAVDLEASVEANGIEAPVRIQDISESGAAVLGDAPDMTNEQFLDLHIEGYNRLQGRVVRQFVGGYALQFDGDSGPTISAEELAEFREMVADDS